MLLNAAQVQLEERGKKNFRLGDWLVYIVLVVLVILFTAATLLFTRSNFLSPDNLASIVRQTAMVSIMAFGGTFVITAGHIDLSCGAILGLSGLAAAAMMNFGMNFIFASIIGIAVGALVGLINGVLVAKVKIPAFLVTLGTMSICRGLALTITGTKSVIIRDQTFVDFWGAGDIVGIPVSLIWTIIFFVLCGWLYHFTVFGNHTKAIGGNITAAKYSGVKVDKTVILIFIIAGALAAVAGMIQAARLKNGRPEVGEGMELDVVAAVVLGGTAMSGGKGNILNTLVGSLVLGVVLNGLILLGFQQNVQQIVKGIIIILAVAAGEKK